MENQEAISTSLQVLIFVLIIWSAVWKGLALWKSAKLGQKTWFVIMFILNTAGILEIIYLLTHRSKSNSPEKAE